MSSALLSDMDACTAHFGSGGVDDPFALCKWLHKNADSLEEAESLLTSLDVNIVSGVETPAQDSEWVITKSESDDSYELSGDSEFVLKGDEKRVAYAAVLVPDDVDKHGDIIPSSVVEDTAHGFLEYVADDAEKDAGIDTDHDRWTGKGTPVESWVAKEDESYTLPNGDTKEYPEGTWMMGVRFNEEEWSRVKSGELTGFSIDGMARGIDAESILESIREYDEQSVKSTNNTTATMEQDEITESLETLKESLEGVSERLEGLEQSHEELKDAAESEAVEADEEVEKEELTREDVEEVVKAAFDEFSVEADEDEEVVKEVDESPVEKEEGGQDSLSINFL